MRSIRPLFYLIRSYGRAGAKVGWSFEGKFLAKKEFCQGERLYLSGHIAHQYRFESSSTGYKFQQLERSIDDHSENVSVIGFSWEPCVSISLTGTTNSSIQQMTVNQSIENSIKKEFSIYGSVTNIYICAIHFESHFKALQFRNQHGSLFDRSSCMTKQLFIFQ